jgi:endonuclease/exonuclease/phosphatase family metal-dependent hydrolase
MNRTSTASRPNRGLRVLTVNIHKGRSAIRRRYTLEALREALRTVQTDLVLLQEVQGVRNDGLRGPQAEYLADSLWRDHAYGRNAVVQGAEHGNAVLSRWPILRVLNHDVSQPGAEPRGLLHCALDLNGISLHVFCVHLGLTEAHRHRQLASLCEIIDRHVPADAPLLVGGDFNDWRSRADELLRPAGLQEVHRHAHGTHARSFPARFPLLRLDRIYVRQVAAHRPLALPRQPWARLSDHAPLAAQITL